jgi:hypothetical protein
MPHKKEKIMSGGELGCVPEAAVPTVEMLDKTLISGV